VHTGSAGIPGTFPDDGRGEHAAERDARPERPSHVEADA